MSLTTKINDECYEHVSNPGIISYYKDVALSIRHRVDGPAYKSGPYEEWWFNGNVHRVDGPAIVHRDGSGEYWLDGVCYPKNEWEVLAAPLRHNTTGRICKCKQCDGINEYVPYQPDYTCYSCKSYEKMF